MNFQTRFSGKLSRKSKNILYIFFLSFYKELCCARFYMLFGWTQYIILHYRFFKSYVTKVQRLNRKLQDSKMQANFKKTRIIFSNRISKSRINTNCKSRLIRFRNVKLREQRRRFLNHYLKQNDGRRNYFSVFSGVLHRFAMAQLR